MAERDATDPDELAAMTAWAKRGLAGGSESPGAPRDINRAATKLALLLTQPTPGVPSPAPEGVRMLLQDSIKKFQLDLRAACKD